MTDEASSWTIVGVDCASQDSNIGLALGTLPSAGPPRLERVQQSRSGWSRPKVGSETAEWGRKPGSVPGVVAFAGWRPFI